MIGAVAFLAIAVAVIVGLAEWLDRRNDPPEGVSAELWERHLADARKQREGRS